jgi:hypothetical protein
VAASSLGAKRFAAVRVGVPAPLRNRSKIDAEQTAFFKNVAGQAPRSAEMGQQSNKLAG